MNSVEAAQQSLSLIPALDADMDNEHVQALVLLSIYYFESQNHRFSWLLIGLAGRIALYLSTITPGQHLPSQRRRTSLACFVVEGIIAAALGKRSQLPVIHRQGQVHCERNPSNVCELEAEGWEEWSSWEMPGCNPPALSSSVLHRKEPFRVLSTFNQAVLLVEILNRATSPSNPRDTDSPPATSEAPLDAPPELSTWAYNVGDSHPCLAPKNVDAAIFPHDINLHTIYLLIRCVFYLETNVLKSDTQQYMETSQSLASSINNLATKYRYTYPLSSAPLGLSASIMVASRLLRKDDTISYSLLNAWPVAANGQEGSSKSIETSQESQQHRVKLPSFLSGNEVSHGTYPKRRKVIYALVHS